MRDVFPEHEFAIIVIDIYAWYVLFDKFFIDYSYIMGDYDITKHMSLKFHREHMLLLEKIFVVE